MSLFMLFTSYLFVFVCMRLGMILLFIDVCAAVRAAPKNLRCMPLPEASENHSVDI